MSVIWKFTLAAIARNEVQMPKGARVVHVAAQFERPCLWALVDPAAEMEPRRFGIVTTGQHFDPESLTYLGTFALHGGTFIGHVVEPTSAPSST